MPGARSLLPLCGGIPALLACRSLDPAAQMRAASGEGTDLEAEDHGPDGKPGHWHFRHAHDARLAGPDYAQDGAAQEQEAPGKAGPGRPGRPCRDASRAGGGRRGRATWRPVTTPQIIGGILIVVIAAAAAVWYVPRIVRADGRSFTGTVSSSGVTNLNFASSGLVGKVPVQLGQAVRAGQVLATETSLSTTAAISADRAAIAADNAGLAESKVSGTLASIAAAGAQLAKDQAQLASDRVKLAETQIVAPSAGTVIAIDGQTGETSRRPGSGATLPRLSRPDRSPAVLAASRGTGRQRQEQLVAVRAAHDRAAHVGQLAGHDAGSGERDPAGPPGPGGDRRGAGGRPARESGAPSSSSRRRR